MLLRGASSSFVFGLLFGGLNAFLVGFFVGFTSPPPHFY